MCRSLRHLSSSSLRGAGLGSGVDIVEEGLYTAEHVEMRAAFNKLVEKEINPYVDEWEKAQMFPAKEVGVVRHDMGCGMVFLLVGEAQPRSWVWLGKMWVWFVIGEALWQ